METNSEPRVKWTSMQVDIAQNDLKDAGEEEVTQEIEYFEWHFITCNNRSKHGIAYSPNLRKNW